MNSNNNSFFKSGAVVVKGAPAIVLFLKKELHYNTRLDDILVTTTQVF